MCNLVKYPSKRQSLLEEIQGNIEEDGVVNQKATTLDKHVVFNLRNVRGRRDRDVP